MTLRALLVVTLLGLTASAAAAWPGRPEAPRPTPPGSSAPPPAWIETKAKSRWLAYGTYCWKTMCVDMIAPESRPDLPVFAVARGAVVRVHLGFAAKSASVSIGGRTVRKHVDATRRIIRWTAARGGVLSVFATPRGGGDASYHARLRIR